MTTSPDPTRLTKMARLLAQRFEGDEATLAWLFARWRELTGGTDADIAARLGCDETLVPRIAICSRPRAGLFREDVESVAGHFEIAARPLADLVREVETLLRFQPRDGQGRRAAGLLAAARDRVAEEPNDYDRSSGAVEEDEDNEAAETGDAEGDPTRSHP
jgi:hypothetical protein